MNYLRKKSLIYKALTASSLPSSWLPQGALETISKETKRNKKEYVVNNNKNVHASSPTQTKEVVDYTPEESTINLLGNDWENFWNKSFRYPITPNVGMGGFAVQMGSDPKAPFSNLSYAYASETPSSAASKYGIGLGLPLSIATVGPAATAVGLGTGYATGELTGWMGKEFAKYADFNENTLNMFYDISKFGGGMYGFNKGSKFTNSTPASPSTNNGPVYIMTEDFLARNPEGLFPKIVKTTRDGKSVTWRLIDPNKGYYQLTNTSGRPITDPTTGRSIVKKINSYSKDNIDETGLQHNFDVEKLLAELKGKEHIPENVGVKQINTWDEYVYDDDPKLQALYDEIYRKQLADLMKALRGRGRGRTYNYRYDEQLANYIKSVIYENSSNNPNTVPLWKSWTDIILRGGRIPRSMWKEAMEHGRITRNNVRMQQRAEAKLRGDQAALEESINRNSEILSNVLDDTSESPTNNLSKTEEGLLRRHLRRELKK